MVTLLFDNRLQYNLINIRMQSEIRQTLFSHTPTYYGYLKQFTKINNYHFLCR